MFSSRSFNDYNNTAKTAYYNYHYALRLKQCHRANHPVMLMTDKLLALTQIEVTAFVKKIVDANELAVLRAALVHLSDVTKGLKAERTVMENNGQFMTAMTMGLDAQLLSELIDTTNLAINKVSSDYGDRSHANTP